MPRGQRFCVLSPGGTVVKNPPANAGDMGSISGFGRPPGGGHGNPLQSSCLENPMDRGAWQATVHGVARSQTRLRDFTFTFHGCFRATKVVLSS